MAKVPKRIANTIINALQGGVVPRIGLPYIAVGRKQEIEALLHDVSVIEEGGGAFRFVVGKYGSGKSFLLQTIRNYGMDRNFVVMDADLSPERRLHGTKGQGLATYRELMRNLSTKTRPDGGALPLLLDKWINSICMETAGAGTVQQEDPAFMQAVQQRIFKVAAEMEELVHGFDFAKLLVMYYRAYMDDDAAVRANVLKWFRGEYATKTEVRQALSVGIMIDDDNWYDYLKLFARFFVKAGYRGLLIMLDELVNIYKIPNPVTRQYNYEKLLAMYNDTMQGKAAYIGFLVSGTPQCMEDTRRGVFSYEALRSRLAGGRFAEGQGRDLLAPVIRLAPLTNEELYVLMEKLAAIHSELFEYPSTVTEQELIQFIQAEYTRMGADQNLTPREVIRDFLSLLNLMYQDPRKRISDLMGTDSFSFAAADPDAMREPSGAFAEFDI